MAKTRFGSLDGIHQIKKHNMGQTTIISAAIFLVVLIVFLMAVSLTSAGTQDEQRQILESAIDRGIMQCYITEGKYPESFEYLCDNYGVVYDEERFRVDYVIFGTNMKPTYTVIDLE